MSLIKKINDSVFNTRVALIILLYVIVRVAVFAIIVPDGVSGDGPTYLVMASNIATKGVISANIGDFPQATSWRAPFFPMVAASTHFISSNIVVATITLHFIFDIAIAFLILASISKYDKSVTSIFAYLYALQPFTTFFALRFLSEMTTATLLATAFFALSFKKPTLLSAMLAGIALGCAAMARDIYLLLPVFAALFMPIIWSLTRTGTRWPRWGLGLSVLLFSAFTITPLFVRNCIDTSACTPVSSGLMWFNLWVGTWERDGSWNTAHGADFPNYAFVSKDEQSAVEAKIAHVDLARSNVEFEQYMKTLTFHNYLHRPGTVFVNQVKRLRLLWVGTRSDLVSFNSKLLPHGHIGYIIVKSSLFFADICILSLAIIGAIRQRALLVTQVSILFILYNTAIYFPFHDTETRFTFPVLPIVLALAGFGVACLRERGASIWRTVSHQVGPVPSLDRR